VFDSPSATFDSEKHSILFQFNQGIKLREQIPNIEVNIIGVADATCAILQVTDVSSGSINHQLTAGRNLKIRGTKIKIVGSNPFNGIYFINTVSRERTKVEIDDIAVNKPSELIFITPALPKGNYRLEIATQYTSNSTPLKAPRVVSFDKIFSID